MKRWSIPAISSFLLVNSKLSWKLLYTAPDNNQTAVSIDLSGYIMVIVITIDHDNHNSSHIIPVGSSTHCIHHLGWDDNTDCTSDSIISVDIFGVSVSVTSAIAQRQESGGWYSRNVGYYEKILKIYGVKSI